MNWRYRCSLLGTLPLVLVVGAGLSRTRATPAPTGAAIVAAIDRSTTISAAPGRADAENTFIVGGLQAPAVRLLSRSLDMNMGTTVYAAHALGDGRWQVANAEVPMVGRWGIEVQARRGGSWVTVGTVAYAVPFTGTMHLLDHTRTT